MNGRRLGRSESGCSMLVFGKTAMSSNAYQRILEELCGYLAPERAKSLLDDTLWQCGVPPEAAAPYDIRTISLEVLPEKLAAVLTPSVLDTVLDRLEFIMRDMHRPPTIPPARCREASLDELDDSDALAGAS